MRDRERDRETNRERKRDLPSAGAFPKCLQQLESIGKPKPGVQKSIWVSSVDGENQLLEPPSTASQDSH